MTTFKRLCKSMLKEENYIEALGYCCERLLKIDSIEKREEEVERIDEVLWNIAENCDIEDAMEQATRIYTALLVAMYD